MKTELQSALLLMRQREYNEAISVLNRLAVAEGLPTALRESINFNIRFCSSRLNGSSASIKSRVGMTRIGVITPHDRTKGIYRDMETIMWALNGAPDFDVSAIVIDGDIYQYSYSSNLDNSHVVLHPDTSHEKHETRTTLSAWLSGIDIIFVVEALNRDLIQLVRKSGNIKKIVFIPNLEWAVIDPRQEDYRPWVNVLRSENDLILSLARTESIYRKLRECEIPAIRIDWSVPDEVIESSVKAASLPKDEVVVLINAGNYGYKDRRGFDVFLKSLAVFPDPTYPVRFIVKANKPYKSEFQLINRKNIRFDINTQFFHDRGELLKLYDRSHIVLYPSRFEGFGLSLLEALHRGCYVLATNGEPMSELVPESMLKIDAQLVSSLKLANVYEPQPDSLAIQLSRLLQEGPITYDFTEDLRNRQSLFTLNLVALCRLYANEY
jgi:glycosyltransferase involved in cell wall biosynthesis